MSQFINEEAIKASTTAMEKGYEQFWALTKAQCETLFPAAAKNIDDVAALNKANYEAATKAGQAAAKVFETLGQSIVAYNQEAFEASVEGAKAFFACKSFQEVVELQSKQAQDNFDKALAHTAKVGELTTKAASDTLEPVNAHVTKVFKDLTKSAKAAAAA
jgi:hypothetical protein